jgi:hypothetical protein
MRKSAAHLSGHNLLSGALTTEIAPITNKSICLSSDYKNSFSKAILYFGVRLQSKHQIISLLECIFVAFPNFSGTGGVRIVAYQLGVDLRGSSSHRFKPMRLGSRPCAASEPRFCADFA